MNSPKISVIVPVYNKGKYIAQLINSIKSQRFRDFECYLIDDGSTDNSGVICDLLTDGDPVFTVLHIENGGASHARNIALELAQGKYITFVDSDDEIPENYLQRIADDIRLYAPDMVIGRIKWVYEIKNSSKENPCPYEDRIYTMQELMPSFAKAQADCGVFGWCVNKTFRRELLGDYRFDESLTLYEDFDFYLKVYPRLQTVYFDNNVFYHYISERSNFSSFVDSEIDYLAQAKVNLRYKKFLEEQKAWSESNKTIVSDAIQRFVFLAVFHSPIECFDDRFEAASVSFQLAGIHITENNRFKRLILLLISRKQCTTAKAIMKGYRLARQLLGR